MWGGTDDYSQHDWEDNAKKHAKEKGSQIRGSQSDIYGIQCEEMSCRVMVWERQSVSVCGVRSARNGESGPAFPARVASRAWATCFFDTTSTYNLHLDGPETLRLNPYRGLRRRLLCEAQLPAKDSVLVGLPVIIVTVLDEGRSLAGQMEMDKVGRKECMGAAHQSPSGARHSCVECRRHPSRSTPACRQMPRWVWSVVRARSRGSGAGWSLVESGTTGRSRTGV